MHILLTNDDGIFAPGLAAIYKKLTALGKVSVVAPADVMSGASHSISLEPLICQEVEITGLFTGFSVHGSPADCVKLALMELIDTTKEPVDLVISGINHGANVGINVYYSGTVAAAIEAAFFRIPSIAVSAAFEEKMDFQAIAEHASSTIKKLIPMKQPNVINVNIPRLSQGKPKGIKVVPQATAGFEEHYIRQNENDGQTVYKLNGGAHRDESKAPTDTSALLEGFITVTALQFDMTDHKRNDDLNNMDL